MRQVVKRLLAQRVRAIFNDQARGERPVTRREDGLLGPDSVAWRVHGDVTTMMVGGVAALLLQMLHPAVLVGVWDHSNFRHDMPGRLRRTARFIALTTYGGAEEAEAALARVRAIHRRVGGLLPDGTRYSAVDPQLLGWVHATESLCFLNAWLRFAEPGMSQADQDRYFAEVAIVAERLGADAVPRSRAGILALIRDIRPQLRVDRRTREVAHILLHRRAPPRDAVPLAVIRRSAVDLLPAWARAMHGLRPSGLSRPLVERGTLAMRGTLRWAFR